jgi:hypothetical protein
MSPAAVARDAAKQTTATAIAFLISASLKLKSQERYRDIQKSQSLPAVIL